MTRWLRRSVLVLLAVYFVPLSIAVMLHFISGAQALDWRSARRDSAGLAPDPAHTPEAVIQVYAAKAVRWRGAFGVHTWIAVKPQQADHYTRFEVMGFGVGRGGNAVRISTGRPDHYWYGNRPELLAELRGGESVDALIAQLHLAAAIYPHQSEYRLWPGPNSNTFIAYLGRAVPGLGMELPTNAIGKDYLPEGAWLASAPSGTGVQLSLHGLLGFTLAPQEGFELNLLGLSAGLDWSPAAIKLPGLGRIGFEQ